MAISVEIEYEPNVEHDGSIDLEAIVRDDRTGEEPTDPITYLWKFVGDGGLLGTPNRQMVSYVADGFPADPNTGEKGSFLVEITCTATTLDITPDADSISLTTLDDLGIDNIDVNMLVTAEVDVDDLYNRNDADAVASGSDVNIYDNLIVHRIRWRRGLRRLVLDRHPNDGGSMRNYWVTDGHLGLKSVYIIAPDGTVLEFDDAYASNLDVDDESITFQIPISDSIIIDTMNNISTGESFVLGIGDSDTVTGITETASATVTVSVLGNVPVASATFSRKIIRPILDKLNVGFLTRLIDNTAFNKLEDITGKPISCYGIATINIPVYDTDDDQQRYKPVIFTVNLSTRIDGVDEFTNADYMVILQQMGNKVVGVDGRSFSAYSVHGKTTTSFNIAYEEGVTIEAFGENSVDPVANVRLMWFARGR